MEAHPPFRTFSSEHISKSGTFMSSTHLDTSSKTGSDGAGASVGSGGVVSSGTTASSVSSPSSMIVPSAHMECGRQPKRPVGNVVQYDPYGRPVWGPGQLSGTEGEQYLGPRLQNEPSTPKTNLNSRLGATWHDDEVGQMWPRVETDGRFVGGAGE
ncbi:hypothetical protein H257_00372 [Aphanomyces astaci]|uniref:Uncharacterized protein n=1 Tax=Aphanomyces astaci TaxID=112090 RepID=W4HAF9_APHAT|nr:hypothetical protein H257_00372 [Aphanomyces astaci]ETV88932.1 hypothetical protein H257_00372 [Aphanomyces astaci]|eukprot:XP_009821332.1 hypothetical protein H257_00372 [Aphanomyces astaci]